MERGCGVGEDGRRIGAMGDTLRLGACNNSISVNGADRRFQDILGMRGLKERCFYL